MGVEGGKGKTIRACVTSTCAGETIIYLFIITLLMWCVHCEQATIKHQFKVAALNTYFFQVVVAGMLLRMVAGLAAVKTTSPALRY